jgi:hypothetical protein
MTMTVEEKERELAATWERIYARQGDDACTVLEEEFYALEDDLRDRLWAFAKSQN